MVVNERKVKRKDKKMKKLLILAGVIVLTTTSQVFAADCQNAKKGPCPLQKCEKQQPLEAGCPGRMHRPHHPDIKRLEEELNLTDKQKEQLKQIKQKEFEAIKPLKEEMVKVFQQSKQDFEAILTKDQLKKLETLKTERKQEFARRHRGDMHRRPPMPPADKCNCGCAETQVEPKIAE